jgi:thioester reductase-like protein
MGLGQGVFLTGATGLLGQYLLRDLLARGYAVAVLIRDGAEQAAERLARVHAFGEESLGLRLPRPTLLQGDLNTPRLGLGRADRHWLARQVRTVIHAAACVSYQPTADGEPWRTNVNGTRRLLRLCRSLELDEVHHLSTAFVCGRGRGVGASNAYEQSKRAAEQWVRRCPDIRATVYRPSIIVGDSQTGYTSTYHHFYRFLELAVRLSARADGLSLRLPLAGEETPNLVPVDWVSQAIVELLQRPKWHGRTFPLVARQPLRLRQLAAIIEDLLQTEGIQWVGPDGLRDPTAVEKMILEELKDYWPTLRNAPVFNCRNTCQALPQLPPPPLDRDLVARLLSFAQQDGWGRRRSQAGLGRPRDLAHYLECQLPAQLQQSSLARILPRRLLFALDVRGAGGGQWSCQWADGCLSVRRQLDADAVVTYRLESSTFADLLDGRQSPQKAFFDGNVEIDGDMEKALKLALFIEQFLAESSTRPAPGREAACAH